jgi:hypothetical protein
VPDVIYIPFNDRTWAERKKLLQELLTDDWVYEGEVTLLDQTHQFVKVWAVSRTRKEATRE